MNNATAAVVDADGTFGTQATVWFAGSLADCKAYAARTRRVQVLVGCSKSAGSVIPRGVLKTMKDAGLWKVR
jgi:hypothetical protein